MTNGLIVPFSHNRLTSLYEFGAVCPVTGRCHGCRNRSCPKCHGRQIADWLKSRSAEILPCRYFHLVATVPSELRRLFLRHQKTLYGLLMKIAADAVRDLAAEKRYVGAEVGRESCVAVAA